MYDVIKKAIGPAQNKVAPLKSTTGEIINNRDKQMDSWAEHYSELYSRENSVSCSALDTIKRLPVMVELDGEPTTEELYKTIDSLPIGKAPGNDGIATELIKCSKNTLLQPLHNLLCQCWRKGAVPQDMRDANIVTLYKNKGDSMPLGLRPRESISTQGLMEGSSTSPTSVQKPWCVTSSSGTCFFADNAAITTHTEDHFQNLMNHFAGACTGFELTISLNKTNIMGQGVDSPPSITINNYKLEIVNQFMYLGSKISDNLLLDADINGRIGRATFTLARLTKQVWENSMLSKHNISVYRACVISTLLYGSET
ncbi:hypothetical protein SKAU_G00061390 [Synaphobranchus kaupii]|uniref:Reverse transcriptase domain-containing protein n=1 Tax=Synaphobranchus kaupii TaxID=118154 RepID=A0A9Q1G4Y8_SYNKA|nr:hypothetical protein SKAU_G00061390 [Synaphobranchus kaupii]